MATSSDQQEFVTRHSSPATAVRRLGLVEYADGLSLQSAFTTARQVDLIPDSLLLLEHPHVLTVGRATRHLAGGVESQLLVSRRLLAERGIAVFDIDRGGAVTYHGPGQLVAYPILKLTGKRRDVHRYLRDLEEVIIRTLRDFDIAGVRLPGLTGVWVASDKIGSIGVHLSHWVTKHGLALNINSDLSFFDLIHPCGLTNTRMTSMEKLLGHPITVSDVEDRLITHFASVFETEMWEQPIDRESVQVVIRSQEDNTYLLLKRTPDRGGFWQPVTGFVELGESPLEAACREVKEECGLQIAEAGSMETRSLLHAPCVPRLLDLCYAHSFAIDSDLLPRTVHHPVLVREHSYALFLQSGTPIVRLNPIEHEEYTFVNWQQAMTMVPWAGNRRALEMTERLAHFARCQSTDDEQPTCQSSSTDQSYWRLLHTY